MEGNSESGGRVEIRGNVSVGGNFIARDQYIDGTYKQVTQIGAHPEDLGKLFEGIYRCIAQRPVDSAVDKDELTEMVERIEREASKAEQASEAKTKRWLDQLAHVAPDVLELAINALTNPGAAVAGGVRLAARAFNAAPLIDASEDSTRLE